MIYLKKIILFLFSILFSLNLWAKPIELYFWHAMAGSLGDEVKYLTNYFNNSQKDYVIHPVYKGDYTETLTSFAAAYRAHQAPALVQIFEVGTAIMLSPKGIIKPVDELMSEQGLTLPKNDFIQAVKTFYSIDGKLMALPFNISAPVLFYNQDMLAKAGYYKSNFPTTWQGLEILAKKLQKAGIDCTYTSAYPGWILVESYLAIHRLTLLADDSSRVVIQNSSLEQHFKRLKRWQKLGYYRYGGRVDDATVLFTGETCALFSQSSGAYNSLSSIVPFHLGVAALPLDTAVSSERYTNVAGGAALWVTAGLTFKENKGVAQFLSFLAKPDIQKHWHEHTGYLPLGLKGIYAHLYEKSPHPIVKLAKSDLEDHKARTHTALGPQNQIRSIIDEVLEALFAGLISPKRAISEASLRANHVILRFERNTHHT